MALELPTRLTKDGKIREATTAGEHWDLTFKGWVPADSEAAKAELTPQQRGALTRANNRAESQKPDDDISAQAGDANQS